MDKKKTDICLRLIAEGDNQALANLYVDTKNGIYAFLYSYYGNKWDTENAVQSVYLKIKQNAGSYKKGTDGRAWMFQIAKNYALNDLKRLKRERCVSDDALEYFGGKSEIPSGEVFEALNKALTATEREIVILHVLWGYKHREIARLLSLPLGTVTSKYKTSIKKVKDFLGED